MESLSKQELISTITKQADQIKRYEGRLRGIMLCLYLILFIYRLLLKHMVNLIFVSFFWHCNVISLADVVAAYKGLAKEKEALEISLKALNRTESNEDGMFS